MTYAFHMDGAWAEERETFLVTGLPSIPPLAVAKKNPPISVMMTRELPSFVAPVKAPAVQVQTPKEAVHTVLFGLGSASLTGKEEEKLIAFLDSLEDRKGRTSVHGYTCDLGSAALNDRLARRRAATVASFLQSKGIAPVSIEGSGKCCYVSRLRHQNRRVQITVGGERI